MQRMRVLAVATAVALAVGAGAFAAAPAATASGISVSHACTAPAPGYAGCYALNVRGGNHVTPLAGPAGYHPADLVSAYKLDTTAGSAQTIAIIDAFDNP